MIMKNTKENAEKFHWEYEDKNTPNWLVGVPDLVNYLTEYGKKLENQYIPNDAHSFEVFSIINSKDSPTGKLAFIGFKLENGNFDYISVPYTNLKINKCKFMVKFKNILLRPLYLILKNDMISRLEKKHGGQFIDHVMKTFDMPTNLLNKKDKKWGKVSK